MAAEHRATLLEERLAPLVGIGTAPDGAPSRLDPLVGFDVAGEHLERQLVTGNAQWSEPGDRACPRQRIVEGPEPMHGTGREQPLTVEDLGGEQHAASERPAELARQPLDGPLVDHQTELGGRNSEPAVGCRDTKVADGRQLGPGTHRRTVDRGDHGRLEFGEPVQHASEVGGEDVLLDAGQVGARRERGWGAGQHHRASIAGIGLRVDQREQRRVIDCVAPFRSVDGDQHHSVGDVVAVFDPYHGGHCMTAPQHSDDPAGDDAAIADPVRVRRAQVAKWTLLANRVGYLILALAMSLFVLAFLFGFTAPMATAIIASMVISFALLAPSIVLGYAVKAADRDDTERGF